MSEFDGELRADIAPDQGNAVVPDGIDRDQASVDASYGDGASLDLDGGELDSSVVIDEPAPLDELGETDTEAEPGAEPDVRSAGELFDRVGADSNPAVSGLAAVVEHVPKSGQAVETNAAPRENISVQPDIRQDGQSPLPGPASTLAQVEERGPAHELAPRTTVSDTPEAAEPAPPARQNAHSTVVYLGTMSLGSADNRSAAVSPVGEEMDVDRDTLAIEDEDLEAEPDLLGDDSLTLATVLPFPTVHSLEEEAAETTTVGLDVENDGAVAVEQPQAEGNVVDADDARQDVEEGFDGDNLFGLYLSQVKRVGLLKAEEEVDLAQRIELGLLAEKALVNHDMGDPTLVDHLIGNGMSSEEIRALAADLGVAKDRFARANGRLVVWVANKYSGGDTQRLIENVLAGNLGLTKAIQKFDYTKGYKFSGYAAWWIRREIIDALSGQMHSFHLPRKKSDDLSSINRAMRDLQIDSKDIEAIAAHTGIEREDIATLLEFQDFYTGLVSFDSPVGEDGATFGELEPSEDEPVEEVGVRSAYREELKAIVHPALDLLTERERQVAVLKYGFGCEPVPTMAEIGRRLGISRKRVSQLDVAGTRKLRTHLSFMAGAAAEID